MSQLQSRWIDCPYCGESIEVSVDSSAGDQRYIEDCQVCCAPIEFSLRINHHGDISEITVSRDND